MFHEGQIRPPDVRPLESFALGHVAVELIVPIEDRLALCSQLPASQKQGLLGTIQPSPISGMNRLVLHKYLV